MKRRKFIQNSATFGLFPLLGGSLPFRSIASTTPFAVNPCEVTDRSVVIIFLNGGNDIFNTVIPMNQYDEYVQFRPNLHLPENSLITLDGNLPDDQQVGFHPRMTGFKNLYDEGMLNVVQRVGYELPNKSHFKALDNWLSGSGGTQVVNEPTGWVGRFLKDRYPGYNGNPFLGEPDPLGILFGSMNKTGFHTFEQHSYEINLSGQDPAGFYSLISSLSGEPIPNIPMTDHGEMLRHITEIENSVNVYAQRISETFNNGSNSSVEYPDTSLGNQLRTIARMMNGGSRTKIFMATTGGFDTHVDQLKDGDQPNGKHADLLQNFSDSVKAFQDDLAALALDGKVLTVLFSEFGRKIIQNDSFGCDHGTLSTMFVVGKGVQAGVTGTNIDLTHQDNQGAAHPSQLQNDYRSVFSGILQDWLGASNAALATTFIDPALYSQKPDLIKPADTVPESCYYEPEIPIVCACLQVRVALEGYFDAATQNMRTNLADSGEVPNTQPYAAAPFFYNGNENFTNIPDDTVDWLLLELRDADDATVVIARKAVLLRKDGFVMETDGTPGVSFEGVGDGSYRLSVLHRSHLGVLSSEPLLMDAPTFSYDFTQSDMMAEGHEQMKKIVQRWCLLAGDLNNDHLIDNRDRNLWKQAEGENGYRSADFNGDGTVDAADEGFWLDNRSKLGQLK